MSFYTNHIIIIFSTILVIEFVSINYLLIKNSLIKKNLTSELLIFNIFFSSMYLFFETKLFAYLGILIVVVIELILLKKEKKKLNFNFLKDTSFILTFIISSIIILNCIIALFKFELITQLRLIPLHILCLIFFAIKKLSGKENIFTYKFSNLFNKLVFFLIFQFYILFIILTYFLEDFTGSINFNTSWENFLQYQDILYPSLSFLTISLIILFLIVIQNRDKLIFFSIGILFFILEYYSVRLSLIIAPIFLIYLLYKKFKFFPQSFFYICSGYIVAIIGVILITSPTHKVIFSESSYVDLKNDVNQFIELENMNDELDTKKYDSIKILNNDPTRVIGWDTFKNYFSHKMYFNFIFGNGMYSHKVKFNEYIPNIKYLREDITLYDEYQRLVIDQRYVNPWDKSFRKQLIHNFQNPEIINDKKVLQLKISEIGPTFGLITTIFDNGLFICLVILFLFFSNIYNEINRIDYIYIFMIISFLILILPNYENLFFILFFSNLKFNK